MFTVIVLELIYVVIVTNNTIDPQPDAPYSSINLELEASPISQKLKQLT